MNEETKKAIKRLQKLKDSGVKIGHIELVVIHASDCTCKKCKLLEKQNHMEKYVV